MSPSSRTQTYVVTPPWRFVPAVLFSVLGALGLLVIVGILIFAAAKGEWVFLRRYGIFFSLCGAVCLSFSATAFVAATREIVLGTDAVRINRWPWRDVVLGPNDIVAVRPLPLRRTLFVVSHRNGRLLLPFGFDGFHEVVSAIRRLNPDAKLRGC